MFYQDDKTAIFIDGSNTHHACQGLRIFLDYKRLRKYFMDNTKLVKIFYYTAMLPREEGDNPLIKLVDWLSFNGFCVRQKNAKTFSSDVGGQRFIKGNMDIELCVDAMRLIPVVDHFVIFTGDGDFRYLVDAIQSQGKIVTAVSSIETQPRIMADELRRQVDNFIELKSAFVESNWAAQKREQIDARSDRPLRPAVVNAEITPKENTETVADISNAAQELIKELEKNTLPMPAAPMQAPKLSNPLFRD